MAASTNVDGKNVPLLSPPPPPALAPTGEEESPDESRDGYSLYWSFLTPARRAQQSPTAAERRTAGGGHVLPTVWNQGISIIKIPLIILVLALVWPFGAISFKRFQNSTDSTFHPIPGSLAAQAQNAFAESYQDKDWLNPMHPSLLVVLEASTNHSLVKEESPLYQPARDFSLGLAKHLNETCWKVDGDAECQKNAWLKVISYYSLQDEKLHWLSKTLTTNKGDTVLLSVQYLLPENATNTRERVYNLMDVVQQYGNSHVPTNCTVAYTGIKWFQSDLMKATKTDLRRMDAIVLPLALFLLGIVLPNARPSLVWIIPLVTVITTVCSWSIIMRFVSSNMQITQFTPSIMTSLTLAMSIDYSLFLLSRYLEDTSNKDNAIRRMLQYGGHVLLLSGLTLMFTFLVLIFLPLAMLKSVGIGAAVAIGSALIVNLTLVPALLHTRLGDWIIVKPMDANDTTDESFLQRPQNHQEACELVPRSSFWYRLSQQILHPYKSVIIFLVIVQLLIPVALYATQLKSSLSFDLMLPRSSNALQIYHSLGGKLGYGRLSPYRILFDGRDAQIRMDSEEGFDVMHRVLDELSAIDKEGDGITHVSSGMQEFEEEKRTLMDALGFSKDHHQDQANTTVLCETDMESTEKTTNYAGIAVLKNVRVPHSMFIAAKYCSQLNPCPVEILHLIEYVDEASTSPDRFATFVTATLPVNPFSDEGVQWLESARETIQRLSHGGAMGSIQVYIEGSAAIEYDAVEAVYGAFPTVVTITIVVVFVLMAAFFRSIVVPLRSVVSIAMTLCFVFGLCVLVYQHGILNWTRIPSWTSTGDEISWLVPVMAFSIIVGLALDYDVFLISRILEYRNEGIDHESSIVAGLYSTGGIITAAGVIMAVAFGGLMFSSSPVLYQWSFLLTSAVLLDTFVIRSLVVPIVIGWTGKWSWWPRRLPEVVEIHMTGSDDSRHSLGPLVTTPRAGPESLARPLLSP